ncbi:MAG TPA: ABC transporter ATP-binding protein, partial [Candidatus Eisenbacteria bacterium]|nr:ABC transporter ATP-binding protein [Candidatus Eisenbacteria bacterium]
APPGARPREAPVLRASLLCRAGEFTLDAALEVARGGIAAVVGESGAGKSTLLRALAGLMRPARGRIEAGGEVWCDTERGLWTPPERRDVGWVPQDLALFPHLTVRANVAFGLRASGLRGAGAQARVEQALERFGLVAFAARRPGALSGGERQRVALARALVLEPRLVLLDEPLSALDRRARPQLRAELRRRLAALPCATVLVTHEPLEALALGHRVVVLERGRVVQQGTAAELLARPRSRYVAEFVGVNRFEGRVRSGGADGAASVEVAGGVLAVAEAPEQGAVALIVRPRDVTLSRERPAGSARNALHGRVEELVPGLSGGDHVRVRLGSEPPLVAEVTAASAAALGLAPGVAAWASFKATAVEVHALERPGELAPP